MTIRWILIVGWLAGTIAWAENKPGGRFVQFSKQAKGSGGKVRIKAATFFGGSGNERFTAAHFLSDGSVLAAISFRSLPALDQATPAVLGRDTGTKAETDTGALVHFSPGLQKVRAITRLAWDAGTITNLKVGEHGVWITGGTGPQFPSLKESVKKVETVEHPNPAKKKTAKSDSYVAKLSMDLTTIEWLVVFPHRTVAVDLLDQDSLWVESGKNIWVIGPNGKVNPGPEIDKQVKWRARTPTATDPRDGSFYIGGEYHSPTGLEPWRAPFLHKFDRNGKVIWTAWNWRGPMVGTEPYRLVSDSAVRQIKVGTGGDVLVGGWSDGGNSVFLRQPFDLDVRRPASKFGDSVWGAGVLSVAHIMRLDAETMELKGGTTWLTYHAYINKPNSARLSDLEQLADGRVLFTGGASYGLIETPDAWVKAWRTEYEEDPETARVKGGPFFAMLSPDFGELLFSSVVPGLREARLAVRGNEVLLYGAAETAEQAYDLHEPTRLATPVQKDYGGGRTDGYLMLIDAGKSP